MDDGVICMSSTEKFMAFESEDLSSDPGLATWVCEPRPVTSAVQPFIFHLKIKDKKSVSFVNPLWNEAALV